MSEELIPEEQLSLDEQIDNKLVKGNVTEAVIADLRERYLPLKIAGIEDKETYLIVKEGRKNCKTLRILASKICKDGREEAVAIQKKWVAKEKEVTGRIAEVEDYLDAQEKEYEAEVAAEKEARKRKQEEQLIIRQQALSGMGALYFNGQFVLGDVSFDFSAIKESEEDIWQESILPKYQEEYNKIEAEQIERDRLKAEKEAELKRQQEELEQKQKELADKEAELKRESDRQAREEEARREAKMKSRADQLFSLGLKPDFSDNYYKGYGVLVAFLDITTYDDEKWGNMITGAENVIKISKEEEAEEKRKEQERIELQNKRYAELLPFKEYGDAVALDCLCDYTEDRYLRILGNKKAAFERAEEEKAKEIAEKAAKAERERIEEEHRKSEAERVSFLGKMRMDILNGYNTGEGATVDGLGGMDDLTWETIRARAQAAHDELIRKQEEERKAEELAKAGDKEKWDEIIKDIDALRVLAGSLVMRSGQYRKKRQMLLEKLEEIKAL